MSRESTPNDTPESGAPEPRQPERPAAEAPETDAAAPELPSAREYQRKGDAGAQAVLHANGAAPERKGKAGSPDKYPYADGRFEVSSAGVFWCKGEDTRKRVCDELRVVARTCDAQSCNWGLLLRWRDSEGGRHEELMPIPMLHGHSDEAVKMLSADGLHVEPGQGSKLREYLLAVKPQKLVRSFAKYGWHGGAYLTPEGAIGEAEGECLIFQPAPGTASVSAKYGRSGKAEQWRATIAALAAGNSRLVLAICCAFAGPLLCIAGEESGGVHLFGESSLGKTTALRLATSVWGDWDRYHRTWRATDNALEGYAAVHNDGLLVLDELSQCEAAAAGHAAYMLGNGQAKGRMSKSLSVREALAWRLLFLSSGEVTLAELLESAKRKVNAGQEVRLASVPADAGAGHGIFENLHGREDAALAEELKSLCGQFHGEVGRRFLERATQEDRDKLAAFLRDSVEKFVREFAPRAGEQAKRVARRFGLLAAAGELATRWGLTGWPDGEAIRGCAACFRAWLENFGAGNHEERVIEERAQGFFQRHGASRFQDAAKPEAYVPNRAGYWLQGGAGRQYLVTAAGLKEMLEGLNQKRASKVLIGRGLLKPGSDGKSSQSLSIAASGQKSTRVYVFEMPEEEA